jgi:fatty-acyl-CoA synthase
MDLLIGDILRNAARAAPRRAAATLGEDRITFAELDRDGNRHAHALAGLGIGYGDRLAVWNDTCLEALPLFAGAAKLGAVYAPVNARLSAGEAQPIVEYARPRALIVDDAHADGGEQIAKDLDLPLLRIRPAGSPTPGPGVDLPELAATAHADDVIEDRLREGDPHVIFFTSGSTGLPKGVILSHRANFLRSFNGAQVDGRGGMISMFPLFHMSGWSQALGCWQSRSPIYFVPDPTAENLLAAVEREQGERMYLIPAVWQRVFDLVAAQPARRSVMDCLLSADTGTSATPPELIHAIRDLLPHTTTRVIYGSTEVGPGTLLPHDDVVRKAGSVGVASPGCRMRLADSGEVQIANIFMFDGYFDNEAATAESLIDGWYQTGDRGVIDDEGFLSIVGRVKDLIRSGGEWVAPPEVEHVLSSCPGVGDVAVVGVPDAQWGEVVCAVVVPRADAPAVTLDALRAHCRDLLAPYKHPRRIELVESFPRTPATGQIQRALIVKQLTGG